MRAELRSLGEMHQTTSLYVTHDYLEALALGDRIAVLRAGALVQVGTREDLWLRPVDTFVASAFGQPRINLIEGALAQGEGDGWFVGADGALRLPVGPLPGQSGRRSRSASGRAICSSASSRGWHRSAAGSTSPSRWGGSGRSPSRWGRHGSRW
jgi:ABC-type sugar transport system ATPase subunit